MAPVVRRRCVTVATTASATSPGPWTVPGGQGHLFENGVTAAVRHEVRVHPGRRDADDADLRPQHAGERHGHRVQRRLRRAVGDAAAETGRRRERGDVHHDGVAALPQQGREGADRGEGTADIGHEDAVEGLIVPSRRGPRAARRAWSRRSSRGCRHGQVSPPPPTRRREWRRYRSSADVTSPHEKRRSECGGARRWSGLSRRALDRLGTAGEATGAPLARAAGSAARSAGGTTSTADFA